MKIPAFSEKLDMPYSTVYGYMRGDRPASEGFYEKAAQVLGISVGDILTGPEEPTRTTQILLGNTSNAVLKLMEMEELTGKIGRYLKEFSDAELHRKIVLIDGIQECAGELRSRLKDDKLNYGLEASGK